MRSIVDAQWLRNFSHIIFSQNSVTTLKYTLRHTGSARRASRNNVGESRSPHSTSLPRCPNGAVNSPTSPGTLERRPRGTASADAGVGCVATTPCWLRLGLGLGLRVVARLSLRASHQRLTFTIVLALALGLGLALVRVRVRVLRRAADVHKVGGLQRGPERPRGGAVRNMRLGGARLEQG